MMKKLAMSFVTYNRARHIREDLSVIAQPTKEHDIDIYIYDGSTDMRTEQVVKQYMEKGYDHIHYFHTDLKMSAADSASLRVRKALLEPNAEYIWMCGDKFVIRPEHYAEILSYIDRAYDIITVYGYPLKGTRQFNSVGGFANYAIIPITQRGASIIKKALIEPFDIEKAREENTPFAVQLTYLRAIAGVADFKGIVIDGGKKTNLRSKYKTDSISLSSMWSSWIANWYRFIEMLPPVYEDIREGLYNRPDLQMGFFSFKKLLRQRSEGQFDWNRYWECRKYVKKVIVMPNIFVLGISILPKSIAKWLYDFWDILSL